jgi:hypothetical protein
MDVYWLVEADGRPWIFKSMAVLEASMVQVQDLWSNSEPGLADTLFY